MLVMQNAISTENNNSSALHYKNSGNILYKTYSLVWTVS